jgi:maltose alpha-D-glucosyltransferase/alpha-amylase
VASVLVVQLELDHGPPERYLVPLAHVSGLEAEEMKKWHPEAVVADVRAPAEEATLIDGVHSPAFVTAMADLLARRRSIPGNLGQLVGLPTPSLRRFNNCLRQDCPTTPLSGEQSNSSVKLGDEAIMKFIRRVEDGVNPGVEIGRFLSERARLAHMPRLGGSIEYRTRVAGAQPATIAVLEEYVPNEDDGWDYVVDALAHGLEEALTNGTDVGLPAAVAPRGVVSTPEQDPEMVHPVVGPHLEWASLLGQRTAEMHLALTSDNRDPAFAPEPLTSLDRQALFHGARSLTRQVLRDVASHGIDSPVVAEVVGHEEEIIDRLRRLSATPIEAHRIRCHGDYHLGQVLWTGKDFVIIDFEGEPSRSLGWRRLKRPAAFDLAGMVRSLHYAGQAAAHRIDVEFGSTVDSGPGPRFYDWLALWHRSVSARFIDCYLEVAGASPYLPSSREDLTQLLDFFRLEKAMYELSYEVNTRPTWVDIPARGILDILGSQP